MNTHTVEWKGKILCVHGRITRAARFELSRVESGAQDITNELSITEIGDLEQAVTRQLPLGEDK